MEKGSDGGGSAMDCSLVPTALLLVVFVGEDDVGGCGDSWPRRPRRPDPLLAASLAPRALPIEKSKAANKYYWAGHGARGDPRQR